MQKVQDVMLAEVQGVQGRCRGGAGWYRAVQGGAGGLHHLHLGKRLSIMSGAGRQAVQAHLRPDRGINFRSWAVLQAARPETQGNVYPELGAGIICDPSDLPCCFSLFFVEARNDC